MKHWLLGLGFVLVFFGCKSSEKTVSGTQVPFVYDHYFTQKPQRLLFKTRLALAKEEFSGILVIKQIGQQEYRSVFTTETGFKVFDLTIRDGGYSMHYGVGPIEKKFIAVRLAYSIQAMLLRPFGSSPAVLGTGEDASGRFEVGSYRYLVLKKGPRVQSQTVYLKKKRKAEAQFSDFGDDNVPDSATVNHFGFPLTASFRLLAP